MRGVLFDVDDTLVDHSGAQQIAIVDYLVSLGLDHDVDARDRWRAAEERQFSRHLTGELSFQGQRRARVREMLAPHGDAELDDAAADARFAGYTTRFEAAWTTYVGADHQLRKLEIVGLAGLHAVGLDRSGAHLPAVPDGVRRVASLADLAAVLA